MTTQPPPPCPICGDGLLDRALGILARWVLFNERTPRVETITLLDEYAPGWCDGRYREDRGHPPCSPAMHDAGCADPK